LGTKRRSTLTSSTGHPDTPASDSDERSHQQYLSLNEPATSSQYAASKASREQLLLAPSAPRNDFGRRLRSSFSGGASEKAGESTITPTETAYAVDEKGRRVRNYERHEGGNRFYGGGRLITSRDSAFPFLASLAIALLLPILFFIFAGSWLWFTLRAGKAAAVIVAYLVGIMWSSMLRTAWRDPGISGSQAVSRMTHAEADFATVPRNLHDPDIEYIACPYGAEEDIGGGRAEQPKPRYVRYREEMVISKCAFQRSRLCRRQ
jgi:palmitoyltransferase ZDHHC9/14/18